MNRLDELPPDQRAALALIVKQRRSYAELASVLGISEQAVHDRAHAALLMLAPGPARELTPEQRARIGDHLLGQDAGSAQDLALQELLASAGPAREWARALHSELAPLAPGVLPEIPAADDAHATDTAPVPASGPRQADGAAAGAVTAGDGSPRSGRGGEHAAQAPRGERSSRLGGAILLGLIVAGIVVAVVLLTGGGGSHKRSPASSGKASRNTPHVTAQFGLRAVESSSHAVGAVEVLQDGSRRAFYMVARNLPPTHGFYYAIWLYNSPSSHEAVSRAPSVGSSHAFEGGSFLPADAGRYKSMIVTRETDPAPKQPGTAVLAGGFTLSG